MRQWRRRLTVTFVVAALVAPALFNRDSFPLATYPMYSRSRGDVVAVATANGVTSSGQALRLSQRERARMFWSRGPLCSEGLGRSVTTTKPFVVLWPSRPDANRC